jgi:hypothetical protein
MNYDLMLFMRCVEDLWMEELLALNEMPLLFWCCREGRKYSPLIYLFAEEENIQT